VEDLPQIPEFQLQRLLGQGASGRVYLARETAGLARLVALKVFAGQAHEAFLRELEVMKRVEELRREGRHTGIVQAFSSGEHAGCGWIALEYLEEGSLQDRVQRGGAIECDEALDWIEQAATALSVLHEAGMFHRDVKPANLLLGSDNRVRLGDFGLSRDLDGSVSTAGSPAFSAPEVIAGRIEPTRRSRVDVYGLGATLSYLLTGENSMPGRPDAFALERSGTPRAVIEFLLEAMAYEAEERPRDAREFLEVLEGVRRKLRTLSAPPEGGSEERVPMTQVKPAKFAPSALPTSERDDVHVSTNRCPYCHDHVEIEAQDWVSCKSCQARHHESCWTESASCGSCGATSCLSEVSPEDLAGQSTVLPTSVFVIGWAWILLGGFTCLTGLAVLLVWSQLAEEFEADPFLSFFPLFAIGQVGVGLLGATSGVMFLRLRAWARTALEALTWLLLIAVSLTWVGAATSVEIAPLELALILGMQGLMFGLPLVLMLRYLRSSRIRRAFSSQEQP